MAGVTRRQPELSALQQNEETPKDNREGMLRSNSTYLAILPRSSSEGKKNKESSFVIVSSIWFSLS